ncbi:bifunctional 3-(3-hydroxy-phenyl)propionate/3-hydroxycinnamic acid hydroxylase [Solimonas terrae]|uniref:Bifunctional 3-(3-hydroxy-phenyl)propionate/3-hydroxycinnamic acid hydroxylase n=1 Tax=Solimonas terrae TaxID=1396819 RepID=A0A6M2BTD3_9GAMM|nr:bifunctional 3-(3-hydroxy-phenyl)propionate/3-hydroxycinnamic acid hydroxylase [Solimonas terrae]NGY05922.1 bifunctional 3-(3-hydroxy-phenyl)propionate/3-hydroxycinnamic acid hydroxylase [Solimonas terrae]
MDTNPTDVDVLVVGYGPVGAMVACFLGRYGIRAMIVDKAQSVLRAPRAIALDNEALRIVEMAGVSTDAFDKVVIPFVKMRSPYWGHFGTINTSGKIDGHPKLVTFFQPDLERALRESAESYGCLTIRCGVELLDMVDDGSSVRATLKGDDGRKHEVRARFVVGADGANSHVRRLIGQEFQGESYSEDWLIVDALGVKNNIDHVEFICNPRRPTPHMVAPGGRTRWEFMLAPGESREEMEKDESIKRLLTPWADPDKLTIERKAVYRFHARSCERYSKGRVFLAGDAAHITPPFVGQGLVSGMRDALNLTWKLTWVVRGSASSIILDSYDEERRPHAVKMIGLAKKMGQLVMPRSPLKAIIIHGSMRLLRIIPPVRRFLEEFGPKPRPEFPSGLFVTGSKGLKKGAMLPQFSVVDADGKVVQSDAVLGLSFSLVTFDVDVSTRISPETRAAWTAIGGNVVDLQSKTPSRAGGGALRIISDNPLSSNVRGGWCAVIRPDQTILHDGPIERVDDIVREALDLLTQTHAQSQSALGPAA